MTAAGRRVSAAVPGPASVRVLRRRCAGKNAFVKITHRNIIMYIIIRYVLVVAKNQRNNNDNITMSLYNRLFDFERPTGDRADRGCLA